MSIACLAHGRHWRSMQRALGRNHWEWTSIYINLELEAHEASITCSKDVHEHPCLQQASSAQKAPLWQVLHFIVLCFLLSFWNILSNICREFAWRSITDQNVVESVKLMSNYLSTSDLHESQAEPAFIIADFTEDVYLRSSSNAAKEWL